MRVKLKQDVISLQTYRAGTINRTDLVHVISIFGDRMKEVQKPDKRFNLPAALEPQKVITSTLVSCIFILLRENF